MRLGKLESVEVVEPLATVADYQTYVNDVAADAAHLDGAVAFVVETCGQPFGLTEYSLQYTGSEGGEFLLMPPWAGLVLAGVSLGNGTTLDTLDPDNPIVTLPTNGGNGTLTIEAGNRSPAMKQAILYVAGLMYDSEPTDKLPGPLQATLDTHKRAWRSADRPRQVFSFNPETGEYSDRG